MSLAAPSEVVWTVNSVHDLAGNDESYTLTGYFPGLAKSDLELSAESGAITVTGRRVSKQPESWPAIYRESSDAAYELVPSHDNAMDIDNIRAELRDGVLPKAEALKSTKILEGGANRTKQASTQNRVGLISGAFLLRPTRGWTMVCRPDGFP